MSRNPHKNPNPQGKGLVRVLSDWQDTRPACVVRKEPAELLFDWFVSALVLSARFQFKPVVGQRYYLYSHSDEWRLSLVGPQEWGRQSMGVCLGCCELREDMTWSMQAVDGLAESPALQAALAGLAESFVGQLDSDAPLEGLLPGFRRDLPYYQCMLATGLGVSLRQSLGEGKALQEPVRCMLSELSESLPKRLLSMRS
ncbi:MAG: hypothetical protein ACI87W_003629 [Halieaceae bacterium]|jgi:hypothetical protein